MDIPVLNIDPTTMSVGELVAGIKAYGNAASVIKTNLNALNAELARRSDAAADQKYADENKQHGVVHFTLDNVPLTADISKKVEWDSNKLMAVAAKLPWEKVQTLFKIEMSMGEKVFAVIDAGAIAPEIVADIKAARTVKYGEPKITPKADDPK